MSPSLHLLITTIGYSISFIAVLGFGFFVLFQKPYKLMYLIWFFCCLSIAAYQLAFIIGVNTPANTNLAYWIWYSNVIEDILIGAFAFHFFTLAADGAEKFKRLIQSMYVLGFLIGIVTIIFPKEFVVSVSPKLYLLSYIDKVGFLYYIAIGYFFLAFLLSFYVLFVERALHGPEGKKRINYLILAITIGFFIGFTAFAIDFNIPIDPGISAFLGLLILPFIYGMMKKDLINIRIVIRRVVLVTGLIIFLAILFILLSLLNKWLIVTVPGFKFWMIPVLSALILSIVGFIYYVKEKERERLQYEFITIMAHKFRTPLTHIRWQANELSQQENIPKDMINSVIQIEKSAIELIHLSNLLMSADQISQEKYRYSYENTDLVSLVNKIITSLDDDIVLKNLKLLIDAEAGLPYVYVDKDKLESAIYVFIENAITYTKKSGNIKIKVYKEKDTMWFYITDDGIGIAKKNQSMIFNRFYREESAKLANTEGIGLGLFMAKNIIERQGGSVGFDSEGEGKGSTFWLTLPIKIS